MKQRGTVRHCSRKRKTATARESLTCSGNGGMAEVIHTVVVRSVVNIDATVVVRLVVNMGSYVGGNNVRCLTCSGNGGLAEVMLP